MIRLRTLVSEITDATTLVAKTDDPKDKQTAVKLANMLKSRGLVARAKYPARFNFFDRAEDKSWGIFTTAQHKDKVLDILRKQSQKVGGILFADVNEAKDSDKCARCSSKDIYKKTPPGGGGGNLCRDCYLDWRDEMR